MEFDLAANWLEKLMLLHHASAIAHTLHLQPTLEHDASHLCHHTLCATLGHVIWEPKEDNQRRKNCLVWVECAHKEEGCLKKQWVCVHDPPCIKALPGISEAEFKAKSFNDFFHTNIE
jgi:hypothetical protein